MEVAESREQTSVGPTTGAESTMTNGERNPFLDDPLMDDGRSSSLSEIDDVSDDEPSDFDDSPKPEKQLENDSEAETERIEDSPHNIRKRDIVLSAGGTGSAGPSPSKLHQSTTLDDVDGDEHLLDDSPSKPRRPSNNNAIDDETAELDDVELPDSIGKKRKRVEAGDETGTELGEDEPLKKRRSSIKSDLSDPIDDDTPLSPEPMMDDEPAPIMDDELAVDDIPESELPVVPSKGRRGKKGKRKTRSARYGAEETDTCKAGALMEEIANNLGVVEEPVEPIDEADDAEAAARVEEECKVSSEYALLNLTLIFISSCEKDVCHGIIGDVGERVCDVAG